MDTAYVLIRIPKSGSTSLEKSITAVLSPGNLFKVPMLDNPDGATSLIERARATKKKFKRIWLNFHVFGERAMWEKIKKELRDGDVISGHFHYGKPKLPDFELRYITLMRNPVDRFLSDYKWIRSGHEKKVPIQKLYHHGRSAAAERGLDYYLDFLNDHHDIYSNPMTRYVCGSVGVANSLEHLLKNYWHFGVLDHPDIFASELEKKIGKHFGLPHLNLSPSRVDIKLSPDEMAKFEKLSTADLNLYHEARSLIVSRR